jgi:hypothetical protein
MNDEENLPYKSPVKEGCRLEHPFREPLTLPPQAAFQHQVEQKGVVSLEFSHNVRGLLIEQAKAPQLTQRKQRHDPDQRIVRAVQQARMQIIRLEQSLQGFRRTVELSHRREITV